MLTLSEAGKVVGRSRQALLKAIKTGRISASRGGSGEWLVDAAELTRVYEPVPPDVTPPPTPEVDSLKTENALLREMVEDLRQDRDRWRETATRLLPPPRRSFWQRLWGR